MQNTDEFKRVIITPDRNTPWAIDTHGSLPELFNIVTHNEINIDFDKFMRTLRDYVNRISDDTQRRIFTSYYWRQMNISEICDVVNDDCNTVNDYLNATTELYLDFLVNDYGIK